MHVINVDIQDNHEEATLGAFLICELCQCVSTLCPPVPCSGPGAQVCLTQGPKEQSLPEGLDQSHLLLTHGFYRESGYHVIRIHVRVIFKC